MVEGQEGKVYKEWLRSFFFVQPGAEQAVGLWWLIPHYKGSRGAVLNSALWW